MSSLLPFTTSPNNAQLIDGVNADAVNAKSENKISFKVTQRLARPQTDSINKQRPPRQSRKGVTSTGVKKAASKSPRARAREFALQAHYQIVVGKNTVNEVDIFTRDLAGFNKSDTLHYHALLYEGFEQSQILQNYITPLLDRSLSEIGPIERIILWLGAYELKNCLEIPWRVVINEYVELAKEFGGADSYKYINGILNNLSNNLRVHEVQADKNKKIP